MPSKPHRHFVKKYALSKVRRMGSILIAERYIRETSLMCPCIEDIRQVISSCTPQGATLTTKYENQSVDKWNVKNNSYYFCFNKTFFASSMVCTAIPFRSFMLIRGSRWPSRFAKEWCSLLRK